MPQTYDIFLSYASVDNTVLTEPYADQTRWVMAFKVALGEAVDRELGRTGDAQWFFDAQSLRTGDDLSGVIMEALDSTRLLVALVSPGYFHEKSWCEMEREHFLKSPGSDPGRARRIFTVLLDEDMQSKWQKLGLAEAIHFNFYDKNKATGRSMRLGGEGRISSQFSEKIAFLAADIAKRIKELRASGGPLTQPSTPRHGTIVLAAVPGEIEDRRTELADFLTGKGWQVLPERNVCDSDIERCRAATGAACKDAAAFIQLLSRFTWRPSEFDRIQFQAALDSGMVSFHKSQESEKPFFRYRSDDFNLAELASNPEHKKWLQEYDVAARSMPAIKEELGRWLDKLLAKAERRKHRQSVGATCSAITLSVSSQERTSLGRRLADRLKQDSVYAYLPAQDVPDLSQCFDTEHGFVAVFGNENYQRVEKVLMKWRKLLFKYGIRRGHWPPVAVFVSDPPPDNKADAINVSLPDMEIISSRDQASLERFVTAVQRYSNQNGRASVEELERT